MKYKPNQIVRVVGNSNDHGFKIGEKVRLKSALFGPYGWEAYTLDRSKWWYVRESDIEPISKTGLITSLDDLEVGDIVERGDGYKRKILAKQDLIVAVSSSNDFSIFWGWYTIERIKESGYKFPDSQENLETVEIAGRKYDKAEFEEAIKDLKEVK